MAKSDFEVVTMLIGALDLLTSEKKCETLITRCCGCKRFRNGAGDWVRIIAMPANADFTDGMCVPCIRAWYPLEIAERVVARLSARGLSQL